MKTIIYAFILLISFTGITATAQQQRVVAECTVTYSITAEETNADKDVIESLRASTKTVYIKANDSRSDLVSPSFTQTVLYNKNIGNAVILRQIGNNKFMTRLDNAQWVAENKRYDGMTVTLVSGEGKTLLGYDCKKAVIQLKDGTAFTIFYAGNIVPSVKEFEYQFKDIPGFVLEYESQETAGKKIKYTATKINLNPVQASRFDVPTSGYRIL
jgi:GLPGLI family protein